MPGSPLPESSTDPQHSIAAAGLTDLLLFFCGRRLLMRVEGRSMQPSLNPNDRVLVKRWSPGQLLRLDQIVVAWHPQRSELRLIKRLKRWDGNRLWLEGDNPSESTDSRQLGWLSPDRVIGVVVGRVPAR